MDNLKQKTNIKVVSCWMVGLVASLGLLESSFALSVVNNSYHNSVEVFLATPANPVTEICVKSPTNPLRDNKLYKKAQDISAAVLFNADSADFSAYKDKPICVTTSVNYAMYPVRFTNDCEIFLADDKVTFGPGCIICQDETCAAE